MPAEAVADQGHVLEPEPLDELVEIVGQPVDGVAVTRLVGPAHPTMVVGNRAEAVGQGVHLLLPQPVGGGASVHEDQRRAFAEVLIVEPDTVGHLNGRHR